MYDLKNIGVAQILSQSLQTATSLSWIIKKTLVSQHQTIKQLTYSKSHSHKCTCHTCPQQVTISCLQTLYFKKKFHSFFFPQNLTTYQALNTQHIFFFVTEVFNFTPWPARGHLNLVCVLPRSYWTARINCFSAPSWNPKELYIVFYHSPTHTHIYALISGCCHARQPLISLAANMAQCFKCMYV